MRRQKLLRLVYDTLVDGLAEAFGGATGLQPAQGASRDSAVPVAAG